MLKVFDTFSGWAAGLNALQLTALVVLVGGIVFWFGLALAYFYLAAVSGAGEVNEGEK